MDYSVDFPDLITNISINPSVSIKQAYFLREKGISNVHPTTRIHYPEVSGIRVFCHLDDVPGYGRKIQAELETALYLAEEIMTELVASTRGYCYLSRPITCIYEGKTYQLEESWWREKIDNKNIILGGDHFIDDLSFLDEEKNFHPMYHFYRVAKDETHPNDYRALNAWRFLEAYFGKSDAALKEELIMNQKRNKTTINNFYENVRCAVAHAKLLKNDPLTDKVIIPRSYETEFDGSLVMDLGEIIKYLDYLVKKANPSTTEIIR